MDSRFRGNDEVNLGEELALIPPFRNSLLFC